MEDEASMIVGPATAALSQMTRMSSARSGNLPSSRLLSTRSHNSRHGASHAPSLLHLELCARDLCATATLQFMRLNRDATIAGWKQYKRN